MSKMPFVEDTPNPVQSRPAPQPDDTDARLARVESELAGWADRGADVTLALFMGFLAIAGTLIVAVVLWSARDTGGSSGPTTASTTASAGHDMAGMDTTASSDEDVEPYKRPDPTLPKVPSGPVKHFRMQVYEHV